MSIRNVKYCDISNNPIGNKSIKVHLHGEKIGIEIVGNNKIVFETRFLTDFDANIEAICEKVGIKIVTPEIQKILDEHERAEREKLIGPDHR